MSDSKGVFGINFVKIFQNALNFKTNSNGRNVNLLLTNY